MGRLLLTAAAASFGLLSSVLAQTPVSCGAGNLCPAETPCCSQYGQCGLGAYCLGGCDPRFSHSLDSCTPAPICQSADYKLTSTDSMEENTVYLGDATKSNWVYSGNIVPYSNGGTDQILLTMANGTSGSLLASTSYVWYGKVTATMKSSRTQGVVSAFILLSDVKDEIDFEFVGTDLSHVQSNYYWQADPVYTNEQNLTVDDTFDTYHTYTIDWQPDTLTWSVDGKVQRTLNKADTFNKTDNIFHYPQTPMRVQLSLWPAGLPGTALGTVEWAGGYINWDSPDVQNAGYFYAMVNDVSVECYNPPPGATINGDKSYVYSNSIGTNNTVITTNDNTVLSSDLGSGTDMSAGAPSATASGSLPSSTANLPTVPGLNGAGTGQHPGVGNTGDSSSSASGSSPSGSSDSGSGSGTSSGQPSSSTDFSNIQGLGGSSAASSRKSENVMKGSMLAVLIAIFGIMAM